MNELANTLRMYAGSNHYDDKCADAMSEAADRLEELEDCDTTCREVYKALDGVPYKGSYADGIETLIKGLATEHARVVGLEKERDSLVSALDTEMVATCLGTYSSGQDPRNALHKLMAWSESVGAYFAQDKIKELEKERDKLILAVADHVTARCELAAQNVAMRDALCAARRFIKNGIELGVIRMPDADCPDPAHNTLPTVEAALNLPNLASEVLKRRDADTDGSAYRLEVMEREHADFFYRWHGERRIREKLVDDVERCYRMLLSEPNAKGALFKAENILREALADAKAATHNAELTGADRRPG